MAPSGPSSGRRGAQVSGVPPAPPVAARTSRLLSARKREARSLLGLLHVCFVGRVLFALFLFCFGFLKTPR